MKAELFEKFALAIHNQECPVCGGDFPHNEHLQTEFETMDFYYCEDCNAELTKAVDLQGKMDFDFCCIVER